MKQISRQLQRVVLVVVVGLLLAVPSVLAQTPAPAQGNGFRISPVRSELVIQKGQSQTVKISVENPSGQTLTAHPVISNFVASDDESGSPRLVLDENTLPPTNDFERLVSPLEDFKIPARQTKEISITISIPQDARSGGYYGAVRFIPILPGLEGRQNVALTASVGTIFLVQVPGQLTQKLELLQFSASQGESARGFFIGGQVSVMTRLKNTGDIHVKPFGKVQVRNLFGKVIHEYEFNNTDPRSNVLPGSTRRFVDNIPQKRWFGRYTITANIGYVQGGADLLIAKTTFWYFATPVFYIMLLLLVLLSVGIYLVLRKFQSRRSRH